MRTINHDQLQQMIDETKPLTILNVLSTKQFRAGHITGSINVPLSSPEFVKLVEERVPNKSEQLVVYCASKTCDASPKASKILEKNGYTNIYDFEGGIKEWHKYGHSMTSLNDNEHELKVKDVMSSDIIYAIPDLSVENVSLMMKTKGVGIIPIVKNREPIGVVTDRDIVIRCLAENKVATQCKISEIMSKNVVVCKENDSLEEIINKISEKRVQRLPVINDRKHLVGMVSVNDLGGSKKIMNQLSAALSRISLERQSA